jgi:hypothetical protein
MRFLSRQITSFHAATLSYHHTSRTTLSRCNIDEVHHLTDCIRRSKRPAMYLKRVSAEVSSMTAPLEELLLHEGAVRKDSAVHVSLSSDSPIKQPGTMAVPAPRTTGEPSKPAHPKTIGCRFTIPVRSFRGASSRRGGRRAVVGLI